MIMLTLLMVLSMFGARFSSRLQQGFMIIKLAPIVVVATAALAYLNPSFFNFSAVPMIVGATLPLGLYAFMGFEMCCSIGHTIENAQKNLSRVVVLSFFFIAILCTLYQLCMYGVLGMAAAG